MYKAMIAVFGMALAAFALLANGCGGSSDVPELPTVLPTEVEKRVVDAVNEYRERYSDTTDELYREEVEAIESHYAEQVATVEAKWESEYGRKLHTEEAKAERDRLLKEAEGRRQGRIEREDIAVAEEARKLCDKEREAAYQNGAGAGLYGAMLSAELAHKEANDAAITVYRAATGAATVQEEIDVAYAALEARLDEIWDTERIAEKEAEAAYAEGYASHSEDNPCE